MAEGHCGGRLAPSTRPRLFVRMASLLEMQYTYVQSNAWTSP